MLPVLQSSGTCPVQLFQEEILLHVLAQPVLYSPCLTEDV